MMHCFPSTRASARGLTASFRTCHVVRRRPVPFWRNTDDLGASARERRNAKFRLIGWVHDKIRALWAGAFISPFDRAVAWKATAELIRRSSAVQIAIHQRCSSRFPAKKAASAFSRARSAAPSPYSEKCRKAALSSRSPPTPPPLSLAASRGTRTGRVPRIAENLLEQAAAKWTGIG